MELVRLESRMWVRNPYGVFMLALWSLAWTGLKLLGSVFWISNGLFVRLQILASLVFHETLSPISSPLAAAKISTQETSQLGSQSRYMSKLLSIVRRKVFDQSIDVTLKFSLSALWNLTDESPQTCNVFLQEGGMQLFLQVSLNILVEYFSFVQECL